LVVNPKYANQGIGRTLLEQLVEIFKEAGTDLLLLTCPVQAEFAKHLYEKIGFTVSAYHMRMKL
jgi:ribosomal protein S18 acetylase RimI-like enzyme